MPHRDRPAFPILFGLLLVPLAIPSALAAEGDVLIRAGTVFTMAGERLSPGAVLISEGTIAEVAASIEPSEGTRVIDLGDGALMPGLIDADLPSGMVEGPTAEFSREITPSFHLLPAVDWHARSFAESLAGGTTTGALLPGTDNVVSGLAAVVKTAGTNTEDRVVSSDAALLITMASDPASRNRSRTRPDSIYVRQPTNRMGVVSLLRHTFQQARSVPSSSSAGSEPGQATEDVASLGPLREALAGRRPILGVSRTEFDILALLRLGEEFGIAPVVLGGQEAYKVIEPLASAGVPVILGRVSTNRRTGPEGTELAWDVAGLLHEAGIPVALSGGDLLEQARFASRFGLPPDTALRAITIEPARLLGVADRVGSIEVGKDADLVALDGDPMQFTTAIRWVMIDGEIRFPANTRPTASQRQD